MITSTEVFKEGIKYEDIMTESLGISVKHICSTNAYDIMSNLNNTYEIKTEISMWERTNNHFCEFRQQIKGKWVKSGIDVSQSYFWCVVLVGSNKEIKDIVVVIKEDLKKLIEEKKYSTRRISANRVDTLTEGHLVNIDDLKSIRYKTLKETDMIKFGTSTITGTISNLSEGVNPNGAKYSKFRLVDYNGEGFESVVVGDRIFENGYKVGLMGKFKHTKNGILFVSSDDKVFEPLI